MEIQEGYIQLFKYLVTNKDSLGINIFNTYQY